MWHYIHHLYNAKVTLFVELTKVLDKCRNNFENIVVLGDLNMEPTNQEMTTFMSDNNFINIIKSNKYFKTSTGTCIDLLLANKPKNFQNTGVKETGVINHHLLIFSFLKTSFTKMPPNKLHYRKYKSFDKMRFLKDVPNLPEKTNYTEWENQFLRVLNKNTPLK